MCSGRLLEESEHHDDDNTIAMSDRKELLFVFQSSSGQSRREKELQDAVRRSHAARNSMRNTKRRKHHEKTTHVEVHSHPDEPNSPTLPVYRPALPPIKSMLALLPKKESVEEEERLNPKSHRLPPLRLSFVVGHGNSDPFDTSVLPQLPPYLKKHLDYAIDVLWPALIPLSPAKQVSTWWRRQHVREPHTVDQQIAAISSYALKDASITDPAQLNIILQYRKRARARTLKWINDQVNDASGPPPAEVVHATISLMTHDNEREVLTYTDYPQSPFTKVQNLHIHGAVNTLPQDVAFLKKLVDLANGPEGLRSPQMNAILQYVDVLFSTKTDQKPAWPVLASQTMRMPKEFRHGVDELLGDSELLKLGHGFEDLPLNPRLSEALSKCCIVTGALHLYHHKFAGAPSVGYLATFRSEAQHGLLSSDADDVMEELIRTTALLFNDMVIFVLPPGAGTRRRWVSQLKSLLTTTKPEVDDSMRRPWLWSLMIGAAAAATLRDNDGWWPTMLATQHFLPVSTESWRSMRKEMTYFLWWDYVLDAPARDVWSQAVGITADPG